VFSSVFAQFACWFCICLYYKPVGVLARLSLAVKYRKVVHLYIDVTSASFISVVLQAAF